MDALDITPATIDDLDSVTHHLRQANLVLAGLEDHIGNFLLIRQADTITASVGLEHYGDVALLRSLAVSPWHRHMGLGTRLLRAAVESARASGVLQLYLLTTTAAPYFIQHGFSEINRDHVPESLLHSYEFRGACPETATLMVLALDPYTDAGSVNHPRTP
jgi:amino-acid N-acetyltransferase